MKGVYTLSTDTQNATPAEIAKDGGEQAAGSQSTGGFMAFVFLALLVAIVAGGFSFYLFQQLEEHKEALAEIKVELSGKVKGSLNNVSGQFTNVSERFNTVTDRISNVGSDMKGLNDKVGTELAGINEKINSELKNVNAKINTEVNQISTKLAKDVEGLNAKLTKDVDGLNAKLETQAGAQRQADEGIHKLNQLAQDLQRQQQGDHQKLLESLDKLYKQKGRERTGWILSEAEYLMLIANHSLRLSSDVKTALTALESADRRLSDMGDPAVIDIRGLVADEVVQLKAVPSTDVAGLAAQLSSMIKQVPTLAVKNSKLPEFNNEDYLLRKDASALDKAKTQMEVVGRKFVKEVENMVAFRSSKSAVQPLIAPKEKYFLEQNLILKLESARAALLNGQEAMYKKLLSEAKTWLNTYFVAAKPEVQNLDKLITELSSATIAPQLPDISKSLKSLRAYMNAIESDKAQAQQAIAQDANDVEKKAKGAE